MSTREAALARLLGDAYDGFLIEEHLTDLQASGLRDETIRAACIRTIPPDDLVALLSPCFAGKVTSAYIIPYGADGFYRAKLFPPIDDSNGRQIRYYQPAGTASRLYIPSRALEILADPSAPLLSTEGEKKALAADQAALVCIAVGGLWNWLAEGRPIRDLDRIDWYERETGLAVDSGVWTRPGLLQAVFAFGKELEGRSAKVRIVKIPAGPVVAEVKLDDFLLVHGLEAFDALPRVALGHKVFSGAARWWKGWTAKKDDTARDRSQEAQGQGREFTLTDPEPWSDSVDGAALLDEIVGAVRRFVVLPRGAAETVALVVILSYLVDGAEILPILAFSSPTKRCGKTRALTVVGALMRRAVATSNISSAALFRFIERTRPTLLIDEADTFLKLSDELRGLLNAGHTRAIAVVIRNVGENHEPRAFSTWALKVVALIGRLPGTIEDRSIIVPMRRRTRGERVDRPRAARLETEFEPLRRRIARWAKDHAEAVSGDDADVPEELDDRAQDNWRPLFAIANLAGGAWPERVKAAALRLSRPEIRAQDDEAAVQLLNDLRTIFEQKHSDQLTTHAIVEALVRLEERPWRKWGRSREPITPEVLARLLRPFGVRSRQLYPENAKGYQKASLLDAWDRYPDFDSKDSKEGKETEDFGDELNSDETTFHSGREQDVSPRPDGVHSSHSDPGREHWGQL